MDDLQHVISILRRQPRRWCCLLLLLHRCVGLLLNLHVFGLSLHFEYLVRYVVFTRSIYNRLGHIKIILIFTLVGVRFKWGNLIIAALALKAFESLFACHAQLITTSVKLTTSVLWRRLTVCMTCAFTSGHGRIAVL